MLKEIVLWITDVSDSAIRHWHSVYRLLFVALILVTAYPVQVGPQNFLQDDSYFYLQIASNIVAGHGSTFHQVTPTNGYHPLWLWITTACVAIAGGNKLVALHYVVVLQVILFLTTAVIFRQLGRMMGLRYWPCGLAVVTVYLLGTGVYGSEAHINALMLIAGIAVLWHALERNSTPPWFVSGLVFGFALLARLDNVFVAFALIGFAILHDGWQDRRLIARRAIATALGGALVMLPYLVYNYVAFGHAMPISGSIKSIFPTMLIDFSNLGEMGRLAAPFGLVALFTGFVLDRDSRRRVVWFGLGAGVVLHAFYVIAYTDHYTFWAWYYVSAVIAAGLTGSYWAEWIAERAEKLVPKKITYVLVSVAIIALLSIGAARAWLKGIGPIELGPIVVDVQINNYRWPDEAAQWMKTNLPPDSIVLAFDYPGAIAFYSNLRILPMDGLVNDYDYNDELLALGVNRYVCEHSIDYYFGLLEIDQATQIVPVEAPLPRQPAGSLTLSQEDIVVRIRDIVSRPDDVWDYAIWELHCPAS
jgi:hypothetical protein